MTTDGNTQNTHEFRGPSITRANASYSGYGPPTRRDFAHGGGGWKQSLRLYDAVQYPNEQSLNFDTWMSIYLREGQVAGILSKLVSDTWQSGAPAVVDDDPTEGDDEQEKTDFEQKVTQFFDNGGDMDLRELPLNRLIAADILATLGKYSILVFGFKDDADVSEPIPDGELDDLSDIAFIEVYSEKDAEFELLNDLNDDRHGRPDSYTVGDKNQEVHHSRVVHNPGADTLVDPYRSIPFFKPIVNIICNIQKILAGSGEGYFRGGYQGKVITPPETIQNVGGKSVRVPGSFGDKKSELETQIEQATREYQRAFVTNGQVETLNPNISSPSDHMQEQWASISAAKDLPQSVLKGNETGERATTEDSASYRSRIGGRRNQYIDPRLFRRVIDLLVRVGTAPEPNAGPGNYETDWEALNEQTEKEKVEIQKVRMDAIATAGGGDPTRVATTPELRQVLDWDPERGSEAPGTEGEQDMTEDDVRAMMDRMGVDTSTNGDGITAPGEPSGYDGPAVERANAATDGGRQGDETPFEIPPESAFSSERVYNLFKELANRLYMASIAAEQGNDPSAVLDVSPLLGTRQNAWNPALHPRDPNTGRFVERPWNVPDSIRDLGTTEIIEELASSDPDFPSKVANLTVDFGDDEERSFTEVVDRASKQAGHGGFDGDADATDSDAPGTGSATPLSSLESLDDVSEGVTIVDEDGGVYHVVGVESSDAGRALIYEDADGEEGFVFEDILFDTGEEEPRDLTPEAQAIEDELGVSRATLDGLSEQARKDLLDGLRSVWDDDLREHFSLIGSVTTHAGDDGDFADAAAAYRGRDRILYINPDTFERNPSGDGTEGVELGGILLAETRQQMVHHELGHARHFADSPKIYGEIRDRGLTDTERQMASEQVSTYAAYNPHEFVAEVHTGLQNGVTFSPDVMDLYAELNGPEVNNAR